MAKSEPLTIPVTFKVADLDLDALIDAIDKRRDERKQESEYSPRYPTLRKPDFLPPRLWDEIVDQHGTTFYISGLIECRCGTSAVVYPATSTAASKWTEGHRFRVARNQYPPQQP